jgi:hypothetical protein
MLSEAPTRRAQYGTVEVQLQALLTLMMIQQVQYVHIYHPLRNTVIWSQVEIRQYNIYYICYDIYLTATGLTPSGSSTVHIYTQALQQYSTHLHTNCTAVQYTFAHKLYSSKVHIYTQTVQQYSTHLHTNCTAVQYTSTHKQCSSTVHIYTQTVHRIHRTEHPVAAVHYTFTHKEYRERNIHTRNNQKLGTYITIKKFKTNLGSAGRAPSLRVIPWHLPYNWCNSTEKPQLG